MTPGPGTLRAGWRVNRATLQTVCGVRFAGCGYSVRCDLPTATTSLPKHHFGSTPTDGRDDAAQGRGLPGAPKAVCIPPHSTPFRGRRPNLLQGTSRVQGEAFSESIFLGTRPEKMCRRHPPGSPRSSSRRRPLRRFGTCRDNEAVPGGGVRARAAGVITWFKALCLKVSRWSRPRRLTCSMAA